MEIKKFSALELIRNKTSQELKRLEVKFHNTRKIGSSINYVAIVTSSLLFIALILNDMFKLVLFMSAKLEPIRFKKTNRTNKTGSIGNFSKRLEEDPIVIAEQLNNYHKLFDGFEKGLIKSIAAKF